MTTGSLFGVGTENPLALWQRDFERTRPSLERDTPSGSVVWALEEMRKHHIPVRKALDLGCGLGRNALYLAEQGAEVTAMDFTSYAVEALAKEARQRDLLHRLRPIVYDVLDPWPVAEDSFDLAIDVFCFKHIVDEAARRAYKDNLLRALIVRGFYLISFAGPADGYYSRHMRPRRSQDPAPQEEVVVDPVNGIPSVVYSQARLIEIFHPEFKIFATREQSNPGEMHGQIYRRQTCSILFRRSYHHL